MVVRLLASTSVRDEKLISPAGFGTVVIVPRLRSEIIVEVQQSFLSKRGEVTSLQKAER
jgi:hypothetical protein